MIYSTWISPEINFTVEVGCLFLKQITLESVMLLSYAKYPRGRRSCSAKEILLLIPRQTGNKEEIKERRGK